MKCVLEPEKKVNKLNILECRLLSGGAVQCSLLRDCGRNIAPLKRGAGLGLPKGDS